MVPRVSDVDLTIGRYGDTPWLIELSITGAAFSEARQDRTIAIQDRDAIRPALGHINLTQAIYRDIFRIHELGLSGAIQSQSGQHGGISGTHGDRRGSGRRTSGS